LKAFWYSPLRLTRRVFPKRWEDICRSFRVPLPGDARRVVEPEGPDYDETVRRLRPFARRRFSTSRPFLVLIRTRKPCVRFRRRRLGWNVRFMMLDPLQST
jgi:hypothetical protein